MFGALIDPTFLATIGTRGYAFAVLLLILVRPLALPLALAGSQLERLEYAAAAWFGPKGFASVVYGVLILQSGIPRADELFHLVALPVAISILAHSSTGVLIARQFHKKRVAEEHSGQTEHAEESQTQ